jgi:hypothetical protein
MDTVTDISRLSDWLHQAWDQSGLIGAQTGRNILKSICVTGQLPKLLRSLLTDRAQLEECAARSYTHANGFDKIVLGSTAAGVKLRLHVWWPNRDDHTENIHNHRWDFSSVLLCGGFEMEFFGRSDSWSDSGKPVQVYEYSPSDVSGGYTVRHQGTMSMDLNFQDEFVQGNVYSLGHHTFHRVRTDRRRLTATLMLQSTLAKATTTVLTEERIYESNEQESVQLSTTALADRIYAFTSRVSPESHRTMSITERLIGK